MSALASHSSALGDALAAACVRNLEALAARHLPAWRIPGTFAGHAVGADVRADLVFTLGHLADAGVPDIGGRDPDDIIRDLLVRVDGRATHSFFSYRIAETLLRHGPFDGNPLLERCDASARDQVARACDTSDWIALLERGQLPRNYAAVLARCELARRRLGLLDDERAVDDLVTRVADLLTENDRRYLDDSNAHTGRFDIYAADVWLFCEPLGARLGAVWDEGIAAALSLVGAVAGPDGAAIPWGRSTGVLARALTVELSALAVERALGSEPLGTWVRRGADAAAAIGHDFDDDGLVNAHRHRAQDRYRGPARRLQLTLDVLGKLAWAVKLLRAAPAVRAASRREAYAPRDELVELDAAGRAAVWTYRSPGVSFVVPFVGTTRSHYLPAPHAPGTFEVPVDADLPCWTPLLAQWWGGRYTAGGVPDALAHAAGGVRARWDRLEPSGAGLEGEQGDPLSGTREMTFRVERRTLVVEETIEVDEPLAGVGVVVPETRDRPLAVTFACDAPHAVTRVDVDGVAEWATPYSAIAAVHQLDIDPGRRLTWSVRVTPVLVAASTSFGHHYDRSLYEPIRGRVRQVASPLGAFADPAVDLARIDLLHLHWPEWFAFDDLAAHERIVDELRDAGVPVVWTAHNLTPHHVGSAVFDRIYQLWAANVDAVIHHTAWGEARMRARYRFSDRCRHEVIPHGHFGDLWSAARTITRDEAERRLGLPPAPIRIGVVGAPRAGKNVQGMLDGFSACDRDDVQLVCWSLHPDDRVPDDPRIAVARLYRQVDPLAYATRLAACDALAFPFDPDGDLLGTGTVADAIGLGLPALASDWGYLRETLGDAAIPLGHTEDGIRAALDALTADELDRARVASLARREELAWGPLADSTADLFERVVLDEP